MLAFVIIWSVCAILVIVLMKIADINEYKCSIKTDKEKKRCGEMCCIECELYKKCIYGCELTPLECGHARRG